MIFYVVSNKNEFREKKLTESVFVKSSRFRNKKLLQSMKLCVALPKAPDPYISSLSQRSILFVLFLPQLLTHVTLITAKKSLKFHLCSFGEE
jgi:hypothetical protein